MEKGLINLLRNQEPAFKRSHFVQGCGSVAWSRGLRVFAVHNGRECLGYSDFSATFPLLNVSRGCLGGKGGQNVTDVYRFRSKETLILFNEWLILSSSKLSFRYFIQFHSSTHSAICPYLRFFATSNHSFIHSCSQSVSKSLMYLFTYLFSLSYVQFSLPS